MQILILGASGMLGHRLVRDLADDFSVIGTVRDTLPDEALAAPRYGRKLVGGFRAERADDLERLLDETRPDVVINCIGIVKQLPEAADARRSVAINALFPHQAAEACWRRGVRFIHFGTDCVFSGRGGPYREEDIPDPVDLYGRSKLLGDVAGPGRLTLRTSIIGHELRGRHGLLEWFLAQRGGRVKGYTKALFSGLTTPAVARIVRRVILDFPRLHGIYHLAGDPIDKFTLLVRLNEAYGTKVVIKPEGQVRCDRRLDGSRFAMETGIRVPSWQEMIFDMRRAYAQSRARSRISEFRVPRTPSAALPS